MTVKDAKFIKSSYKLEDLPKPVYPEFAFIGRSNVGKSSLINMLTNRKNLAKTSVKPGKTRAINHFLIDNKWYLVDLPGYGYAKVSKQERNRWKKLMFDYFLNRPNLLNVFVLIDSRLEPQQIDIDFINQLGFKQIPFSIVFTKTDKLSRNKVISNIAKFKRELLKTWEELPPMFLTSAVTRQGRDELLDFIENLSQDFKPYSHRPNK